MKGFKASNGVKRSPKLVIKDGNPMTLNLATESTGIGKVLKARLLAVPTHQRAFAWKEDEVRSLWDDLVRAELEEPSGYFLGQVVLGEPTSPGGTASVIDGQQRLATVTLIYAAAVHLLYSRLDSERAIYFKHHFVQDSNPVTLDSEPRLRLTGEDDAFFQEMLNALCSPTPVALPSAERESHERLLKAHEAVATRLEQYADSVGAAWATKLVGFLQYVENSVEVIVIQVSSDQNAYLIFETLNDRGVRLTTADLLKNMLYGKSGMQLAAVQASWSQMNHTLEGLDDDEIVPTFLRHYWISNREHVREKQLYKRIRDSITSPTAAAQLASGLSTSADRYTELLTPSDSRWTSTAVRDALGAMRLFRVVTVRPLLMAIEATSTGALQSQLLSAVAGWSIRLAVAGGLGSGSTEEAVGAAARQIRSQRVSSVAELRTLLAAIIVDDQVFHQAFAVYRVANGRQARFMLASLERQAVLAAGGTLEQVPNLDESQVNLEHVMPKNPTAGGPWAALAALDKYRTDVNRLGNQALMLVADNTAAGNDDFGAKKAFYANSSLLLTKGLASIPTWDMAAVDARATELADLALLAWPQ